MQKRVGVAPACRSERITHSKFKKSLLDKSPVLSTVAHGLDTQPACPILFVHFRRVRAVHTAHLALAKGFMLPYRQRFARVQSAMRAWGADLLTLDYGPDGAALTKLSCAPDYLS